MFARKRISKFIRIDIRHFFVTQDVKQMRLAIKIARLHGHDLRIQEPRNNCDG